MDIFSTVVKQRPLVTRTISRALTVVLAAQFVMLTGIPAGSMALADDMAGNAASSWNDTKSDASAIIDSTKKETVKSPAADKVEGQPPVKAEAHLETKSEAKPEAKTEAKAEVKADTKAETKADMKAETKTAVQTGKDSAAQLNADADNPAARAEAKAAAKAEEKAKADAERVAAKEKAKADAVAQAEARAKAKAEAAAEAEKIAKERYEAKEKERADTIAAAEAKVKEKAAAKAARDAEAVAASREKAERKAQEKLAKEKEEAGKEAQEKLAKEKEEADKQAKHAQEKQEKEDKEKKAEGQSEPKAEQEKKAAVEPDSDARSDAKSDSDKKAETPAKSEDESKSEAKVESKAEAVDKDAPAKAIAEVNKVTGAEAAGTAAGAAMTSTVAPIAPAEDTETSPTEAKTAEKAAPQVGSGGTLGTVDSLSGDMLKNLGATPTVTETVVAVTDGNGVVQEGEVMIVDCDEKDEVVDEIKYENLETDEGKTHIKTGARFPVVVSSQISSKTAKKGDPVEARLKYDLKIGDRLIAHKGAEVHGHINYSLKARSVMHSLVSPERWYRNSGVLGVEFDEIINDKGEHLPLVAAPARTSRIVKNKNEGRVLGVNHLGQVTGPWSQQLRYKAVRIGLNAAMAPAGVFSFGAMPVALGLIGAANPSFAFMKPVGNNVRHRRLKGFAWGFLSGVPGSWIIEDTVTKGQESIIKPGDEFLAEFHQEFNGEPASEAQLLPNATVKVHGDVQPTKNKDKGHK